MRPVSFCHGWSMALCGRGSLPEALICTTDDIHVHDLPCHRDNRFRRWAHAVHAHNGCFFFFMMCKVFCEGEAGTANREAGCDELVWGFQHLTRPQCFKVDHCPRPCPMPLNSQHVALHWSHISICVHCVEICMCLLVSVQWCGLRTGWQNADTMAAFFQPHASFNRGLRKLTCPGGSVSAPGIFFDPCPTGDPSGCTKRSARAVQLFGRLAVLEPHTLRYYGRYCCLTTRMVRVRVTELVEPILVL